MHQLLSKYRLRLINYESVIAYSLLGVGGGAASALVVMAFELAIRELSRVWGGTGDGFEGLPRWGLFVLPALGATILGCVYALLDPRDRETGIVHVISRMDSHYSVLPLRNALVQFAGGAFSLATGQSGGREGPGVHLGGAVNSLLGQWLDLPNNSLRVLLACGTAGGIAAAFQTPLAAVLFTMEVIVAEYTVTSFIPVILAAVSASAVSYSLASESWLFGLPPLQFNSLLELPYIAFLGLCCGIAVALFIRILKFCSRFSDLPVALRFAFAGILTGCLALLVPEILGMGDDTLELALAGELALSAMLAIALCKLLATACTCGVGMPVGLIGPSLLIGACLGGVLGTVGYSLQPELASDPMLYVVIGMGATMGAILNAPLAAILAIVEMTQTLGVSVGAMLAIVTACLTNTGLFRQHSAHQSVLRQLKRLVPQDPVNQLLHRTNVRTTMDSRVVHVPVNLDRAALNTLLGSRPTWCLVEQSGKDLYLVDGSELLEWLQQAPLEAEAADVTTSGIRRWAIADVPIQATLRQALDAMRDQVAEAVCIYERSPSTGKQILHGIITRENIQKFSFSDMLQAD